MANYDATYESIGLASDKILAYLKVCKPQEAQKILEYIEKNPIVHSLAHTPLLLELISEIWLELQKHPTHALTRTELFEAIRKKTGETFIQKHHLRSPGVDEDKRFEKLKLADRFTAELAFRGMEMGNTLIAQSTLEDTKAHCNINEVDSLLEPGFFNCRGDANHKEYYFPHLTLQEHWAAIFLTNCLFENARVPIHDNRGVPQWITVEEFIAVNKYNPRYTVVWEFIAGILGNCAKDTNSQRGNVQPLQEFLNCIIIKPPHDILGLYDAQFMQLMEEAAIKNIIPETDLLLDLHNIYLEEILDRDLSETSYFTVLQMLILNCPTMRLP